MARIIAASVVAPGEPWATAQSAALRGQNARTVNIKVAKIIAADRNSSSRYFGGVLQPLINAPREASSRAAELGMKNSPVSTGYRGPYGNKLSDSGGEALQAPTRTRRSNSFAPRRTPQAITRIHRKNLVTRIRARMFLLEGSSVVVMIPPLRGLIRDQPRARQTMIARPAPVGCGAMLGPAGQHEAHRVKRDEAIEARPLQRWSGCRPPR
jgi:hypothetical protein